MNANRDKILCIFHKNCMDGFASAYCVWKHFAGGEDIEFMAMSYGDAIPDLTDRIVYIVDFSFKPEVLLPAAYTAKMIYLMDHHKSAIADWENVNHNNIKKVFDLNQSGVGIVYQYFNPNSPLPFILACVQDYDLWRFEIKDSRNIVTALYSCDFIAIMDFKWFDQKVSATITNSVSEITELIKTGEVILEYQKNMANNIIKRNASQVIVHGHIVPIVAMPRELSSLAGQIMSKHAPFSITYEDNFIENVRMYSLRSNSSNPDAVDVAEVCRVYGGGGHKNAAGFTVRLNAFQLTPVNAVESVKPTLSDSAISYVL